VPNRPSLTSLPVEKVVFFFPSTLFAEVMGVAPCFLFGPGLCGWTSRIPRAPTAFLLDGAPEVRSPPAPSPYFFNLRASDTPSIDSAAIRPFFGQSLPSLSLSPPAIPARRNASIPVSPYFFFFLLRSRLGNPNPNALHPVAVVCAVLVFSSHYGS